jgi:membrane peptidoglycan carboxypeptidase
LTLSVIAVGVIVLLTAYTLAEGSTAGGSAGAFELSFTQVGRKVHVPVRFYDREEGEVLVEALNPEAQSRRWYQIDPQSPIVLPEHVIQASVMAQEDDYWAENVRPIVQTISAFSQLWTPSTVESQSPGIVDLLVEAQVMPLVADRRTEPVTFALQRQLAAAEISARYSRVELLEFFINTADYGNLAYGIDAAALVYFGKHASSLNLAESAMLAPIPFDPLINPVDSAEQARARQRELVRKMRTQGLISPAEAQQAINTEITINDELSTDRSSLGEYLLSAYEARFGRSALGHNGLRVRTTIDIDLQDQSQCVLSAHIARLNNEDPGTAASSDCLASELLPPMRPGDAGKAHNVSSGALVVMDAESGNILSLAGPAQIKRPMNTLGQPYIYLTAFAEGYSPGSMVMDLPNSTEAEIIDAQSYHGPVRIRNAMTNGYRAAAEQMVELVGVESVLSIFDTMGIEVEQQPGEDPDQWRAALMDFVHASTVFANNGLLAGQSVNERSGTIKPIAILEIVDDDGRLVYAAESEKKAVLSDQLAYLVNDVLSDGVARQERFGPSNPLEINRPAAATAAISEDGRDAWALGYTPERVVGVWMGNPDGSAPIDLTFRNSAAPVWHALMIYASRDLSPEDWQLPPGVTRVEVCNPSGLLPTVYCPETVREPFISGTEPTTFDNLFQPYLVNKETGKLATLSTPVELVEENVYLVPPPEALEWAYAIGIEQPPQEYDTLTEVAVQDPDVRITTPDAFDFLQGMVRVRGYVEIEDLDFYRLQVGKGLNPLNWLQLDEDGSLPVRGGTLAEWDTTELEGLYTLQLIAVNKDGQVRTANVHVTVDNEPPRGQIVFPEQGQVFTGTRSDEVAVEVEVQDSFGVDRVIFFVDGNEFAKIQEGPFSMRWRMLTSGTHNVYAEVYDLAGNMIETEEVSFEVVRP